MSITSKCIKTALGAIALLSFAWSEGAFCKEKYQTRVACQNFTGFCSVFAWNYKIYYTKFYECCYNDAGQFTHRNVTGQAGPTQPNENDCCQGLVPVSFTDGNWSLPCNQTETPPSSEN